MKLADILTPPAKPTPKPSSVASDEKILARAKALLAKYGTELGVKYLDKEGILYGFEGCVTAENLLVASKSSYFCIYLTSGEIIREKGTPPKKLTRQEQWDLLTDEDKAMFEALGITATGAING